MVRQSGRAWRALRDHLCWIWQTPSPRWHRNEQADSFSTRYLCSASRNGDGVWPRGRVEKAEENGLERTCQACHVFNARDDRCHSACQREAAVTSKAPPSFEIARTSGTRVLLVEDNEINQEVAIGLFEDAAMQSRFSRERRDCGRTAKENNCDAVLMDMQMPVMVRD